MSAKGSVSNRSGSESGSEADYNEDPDLFFIGDIIERRIKEGRNLFCISGTPRGKEDMQVREDDVQAITLQGKYMEKAWSEMRLTTQGRGAHQMPKVAALKPAPKVKLLPAGKKLKFIEPAKKPDDVSSVDEKFTDHLDSDSDVSMATSTMPTSTINSSAPTHVDSSSGDTDGKSKKKKKNKKKKASSSSSSRNKSSSSSGKSKKVKKDKKKKSRKDSRPPRPSSRRSTRDSKRAKKSKSRRAMLSDDEQDSAAIAPQRFGGKGTGSVDGLSADHWGGWETWHPSWQNAASSWSMWDQTLNKGAKGTKGKAKGIGKGFLKGK